VHVIFAQVIIFVVYFNCLTGSVNVAAAPTVNTSDVTTPKKVILLQ